MIAAATAYASECCSRDPRYIKHPSTFLGPDRPFLELVPEADTLPEMPDEAATPEIPAEVFAPNPYLLAYMKSHEEEPRT